MYFVYDKKQRIETKKQTNKQTTALSLPREKFPGRIIHYLKMRAGEEKESQIVVAGNPRDLGVFVGPTTHTSANKPFPPGSTYLPQILAPSLTITKLYI